MSDGDEALGPMVLEKTKDGYFNLCVQYEHLGKLLHLQSKAFTEDDDRAPAILEKMLSQYLEIGEQLKTVGTGLDKLEGKE